nr:MAG TPA: hypothetical protein [Caudoviricetes sp.]
MNSVSQHSFSSDLRIFCKYIAIILFVLFRLSKVDRI